MKLRRAKQNTATNYSMHDCSSPKDRKFRFFFSFDRNFSSKRKVRCDSDNLGFVFSSDFKFRMVINYLSELDIKR